jgi:hypothetical protein
MDLRPLICNHQSLFINYEGRRTHQDEQHQRQYFLTGGLLAQRHAAPTNLANYLRQAREISEWTRAQVAVPAPPLGLDGGMDPHLMHQGPQLFQQAASSPGQRQR